MCVGKIDKVSFGVAK